MAIGKKGNFTFLFSLVVLLFLIIITGKLMVEQKQLGQGAAPGKTASFILEAYAAEQDTLLALDTMADYSIALSLHKLAAQGGMPETCKKYGDYPIIDFSSCMPEQAVRKAEFERLFLKELGSRITDAFAVGDITFIPSFYVELDEDKGSVNGKNSKDVEVMVKVKAGSASRYTFPASYRRPVKYDFKAYSRIIADAKKLVQQCKSEADRGECVRSNLPEGWALEPDPDAADSIYTFSSAGDKFLHIDGKDYVSLKPVAILFAVDVK